MHTSSDHHDHDASPDLSAALAAQQAWGVLSYDCELSLQGMSHGNRALALAAVSCLCCLTLSLLPHTETQPTGHALGAWGVCGFSLTGGQTAASSSAGWDEWQLRLGQPLTNGWRCLCGPWGGHARTHCSLCLWAFLPGGMVQSGPWQLQAVFAASHCLQGCRHPTSRPL